MSQNVSTYVFQSLYYLHICIPVLGRILLYLPPTGLNHYDLWPPLLDRHSQISQFFFFQIRTFSGLFPIFRKATVLVWIRNAHPQRCMHVSTWSPDCVSVLENSGTLRRWSLAGGTMSLGRLRVSGLTPLCLCSLLPGCGYSAFSQLPVSNVMSAHLELHFFPKPTFKDGSYTLS